MQILIPFYSLYGHVYELAKAIGEGVEKAGASPKLMFVQETLSPEVLEKMGAAPAEARGANLPAPTTDDMVASAGIIFGTPTRFGGMVAQMRAFQDRTGGIWVQQALAGKVGGVFTSSNTQHGGNSHVGEGWIVIGTVKKKAHGNIHGLSIIQQVCWQLKGAAAV